MKPSACARSLEWAIDNDVPIFIEGPPGVGKSALVQQVAAGLQRPLIDVRAVLFDPVDVRGFPLPNGDSKVHWSKPTFFPEDGEGVLFVDELPQAAPVVQSAFLQLFDAGRRIGEHTLPPGWARVAAGNRQQDRTGAHRVIEALRDRFYCITLDVSVEDWQAWAVGAGISPVVRSFIEYRPDLLHSFNPDQQAQAYPTPRSWSKVSLMQQGVADDLMHEMTAGCVGEAAATEFMAFRQICRELPPIDEVLADPLSATVPSEPAVLYALSGALTERIRGENNGLLTTFAQYAVRMPREFAVLTFRDGVEANRRLIDVPEANEWIRRNQRVLSD